MKKIDVLKSEIVAATQSGDGLERLGRQLAAQNREVAQHLRNGITHEEIGQSYLEDQIRLYLVYSLDHRMWEQLVERSDRFANQDRKAMAPMFSPWGYLHSDLVENVGEGLGWTMGGPYRDLSKVPFVQRMGMIVSAFDGLAPSQQNQVEAGLESEASPAKTGGCYVATAVYGSYEAPQVRVLRRWRDEALSTSSAGRWFIRFYYATSPGLVRLVGTREWFIAPSRFLLDALVKRLSNPGFVIVPQPDASRNDSVGG